MQTQRPSFSTRIFNSVKKTSSLSALAAGATILLLSGCANYPEGFASTTIATGTPYFVNQPAPFYQLGGCYSSTKVVYANGYVGPLPAPVINNVTNVTKEISRNNVLTASTVSIRNNQILQNNSVVSVENEPHKRRHGFSGIFPHNFGRPSSQSNNSAISLQNEIQQNNSVSSLEHQPYKVRDGFSRDFSNRERMASRQIRSFVGSHRRHIVKNNITQVTEAPRAAMA